MEANKEQTPPQQPSRPGFLQVVMSTLAAAIGVQSDKNRERDFKAGSFKAYVVAGVLFTALFVLTLVLVVKAVLGNMG